MADLVELKVDVRSIKDFEKFAKDVRKEVIEKGLNEPLKEGLMQLKSVLYHYVNEEVRNKKVEGSGAKNIDEHSIDIPKSHADLIKFLTGADLDHFQKNKDYTTFTEAKVLVVDSHRVRARIPMAQYETFEENLQKATQFFNQSMFIFTDGTGMPEYYLNPGLDISRYVKVVCSRDTGDTPGSRKKFEAYKNSNKMPKQANSDIGRYAEWSLKQEGVKEIKRSYININHIIDSIQKGDFDEADYVIKNIPSNRMVDNIKSKIEDLKEKKNLTPDMKSYTNIISMIRNMRIVRVIKEESVGYELVSDYDDSEEEGDQKAFFDEIKKNIDTWIIVNENVWFDQLVKAAQTLIDKYGS